MYAYIYIYICNFFCVHFFVFNARLFDADVRTRQASNGPVWKRDIVIEQVQFVLLQYVIRRQAESFFCDYHNVLGPVEALL